MCPSCVRHVSACVRLVPALAAPPDLVRHVSAKCPPDVCFGRASKRCPPCVRHVSASCPLWLPLKTSAAVCLSGLVSASPCIRLALYLPCVGFGRASKGCVSHVLIVSSMCPLLVFLCPLIVRLLFALYRFLAGSMVWLWPGFCQLCVRSLVFAPLSVLCRGLCSCGFARCSSGHLQPAVLLSALKLGRAFAPCLSFSPFLLFSVFIYSLSGFCLRLPVS